MRIVFILLFSLMTAAPMFAQSAESDLRALIQTYADTYSRHDPSALAALYSEDALLLPPARPMIKGRQGIQAFWKSGMGRKLTLTPVLVQAGSTVAFVVGEFAFDNEPPSGKFVVNAVKTKQGRWQIVADTWNNNQPESSGD
jgi:uncharacterized protein (TIGR02246 family)